MLSMKELEEEKKAEKERQQRNVRMSLSREHIMIEFFQDDIALVVCMITILAFTCLVVIFKVSFQGFSGDFNGFIQRFMLVATLELM